LIELNAKMVPLVVDAFLLLLTGFPFEIEVPATPWVSHTPGNLNLIFTVPHNGAEKPDSIPDRVAGCKDASGQCQHPGSLNCPKGNICKVVKAGDSYTRSIALRAAAKVEELAGRPPHVIVSLLHRSKMDPNRLEEEAAQGNQGAVGAYRDFHARIAKVVGSLEGPGLLLDFHGQAHKQNSTEIGYLISKDELNSGDLGSNTSINALVARSGHGSLRELVAGEGGLGAYLEGEGCRAVPSPRKPSPGEEKYFSGGEITRMYGSRNSGQVDAIQLEMPAEMRYQGGREVRHRFADALGEAIHKFYSRYY